MEMLSKRGYGEWEKDGREVRRIIKADIGPSVAIDWLPQVRQPIRYALRFQSQMRSIARNLASQFVIAMRSNLVGK